MGFVWVDGGVVGDVQIEYDRMEIRNFHKSFPKLFRKPHLFSLSLGGIESCFSLILWTFGIPYSTVQQINQKTSGTLRVAKRGEAVTHILRSVYGTADIYIYIVEW